MANYSNGSMILHWRDEEGTERIERTRFIHFNIHVEFVVVVAIQSFQNKYTHTYVMSAKIATSIKFTSYACILCYHITIVSIQQRNLFSLKNLNGNSFLKKQDSTTLV